MAIRTLIAPQDLRRLCSGRWLMPILAVMGSETGSRFSALARRLSLSQSVLSRHLDSLKSFGWIARNPGHGHPLRPEYLLTAAGRPIAAWCEQMMVQRARLGLEPRDLNRWSLPLLYELRKGRQRFSELERRLTPVTPRALSLTLYQMLDIRLVDRSAECSAFPLYGLTARGNHLAQAAL